MDLNAQNVEGDSPVMLACKTRNWDLMEWLLSEGGADPHTRNVNGWTLLMETARRGNLPMVQYLVDEFEVDVDAAEYTFNGTAATHAGLTDNWEVLKWLVVEVRLMLLVVCSHVSM